MNRNTTTTVIGCLGAGLLGLGAILSILPGVPAAAAVVTLLAGAAALVGFMIMNAGRMGPGFGRRTMQHGANIVLATAMLLGILVLVNYLADRHHRRFDLTANRRYSLSEQTIRILTGLETDIRFTAFFKEGEGGQVEDLLAEYAYHSNRVSYELVDPDRQPGKARRYGVTTYETLVIETDEKEEKVTGSSEEDLTNALLRVTRVGKKVIIFLEGHGEKAINSEERDGYSLAREALEEDNYEVKTHLLMQDPEVPGECAVLIAAGAQKKLLANEVEAIDRYLRRGGKVLFLLDPDPSPGCEPFLKKWGVVVGADVVVDVSGVGQLFGADEFIPIVTDFGDTEITRNFSVAAFFPYARSVTGDDEPADGLTVDLLAKTSPHSWAETGQLEGEIAYDEGEDVEGPVSLAVVVTAEPESTTSVPDSSAENGSDVQKGKTRLVVFGDSDFASNAYFGLSGNSDLFLNTVSWLAEDEDLIAIRPTSPDARPITLTFSQSRSIFWFTVVLVPIFVLAFGVSVWWRRRG